MTPVQTIETEGGLGSFMDWIQKNMKYVWIATGIVVVGGLGFWFYVRSAEIKRQNAERGLAQAKQSLAAGNAALAQTDLERVASRYQGTSSGAQAAMLLAKLHYDQGRWDQGIQVLQPYTTASAAGASLAAILALKADGQLGQGNPAEAAATYAEAARATSLPGQAASYRAMSARALMGAGDLAGARTIWEELLDNPDAANIHTEAEIRLGELTARTVGS